MSVKSSFATAFIVPVAGAVGTITTTVALMKELLPCLVFIGVGIALLGYCLSRMKKNKIKEDWPLLLYACLMLAIASIGVVLQQRDNNRDKLWRRFIEANNSILTDELKLRADAGDGPSLYELGLRYLGEHDFKGAREHFQKAADGGMGVAFAQLASMDAQGLGTARNPHRAASNMIRARRVDYISDRIIREEELYDQLTETERMQLDETRVELSRLAAIQKEASGKREHMSEVLNRHHDELLKLSLRGYIPATEDLYVEEQLMNPDGSETLQRLANDLYKVNHIPTAPGDRSMFFSYLYGTTSYSTGDYKQHIRDNNYLFLLSPSLFLDAEDHSDYSDDLLVKEYELFRSQLDWCRLLLEDRTRIRMFLFGHLNDYQKNYEDAKKMLGASIMAIKERMTHYDVMSNSGNN